MAGFEAWARRALHHGDTPLPQVHRTARDRTVKLVEAAKTAFDTLNELHEARASLRRSGASEEEKDRADRAFQKGQGEHTKAVNKAQAAMDEERRSRDGVGYTRDPAEAKAEHERAAAADKDYAVALRVGGNGPTGHGAKMVEAQLEKNRAMREGRREDAERHNDEQAMSAQVRDSAVEQMALHGAHAEHARDMAGKHSRSGGTMGHWAQHMAQNFGPGVRHGKDGKFMPKGG